MAKLTVQKKKPEIPKENRVKLTLTYEVEVNASQFVNGDKVAHDAVSVMDIFKDFGADALSMTYDCYFWAEADWTFSAEDVE